MYHLKYGTTSEFCLSIPKIVHCRSKNTIQDLQPETWAQIISLMLGEVLRTSVPQLSHPQNAKFLQTH